MNLQCTREQLSGRTRAAVPVEIYHDALAAHAIVQALKELCSDEPFGGDPYEVPQAVFERADELLKEWTS